MPKNDSNVRAPKGTTVSVARYISSVQSLRLPDEVLLKTKCHLLDSLAAIISGSQLKAGRLAIDFIKTQGGTPESTVWGTDLRTTAINAALVNGIAAHADETDDSHLEGRFHPGCAVIPSALAVGERQASSGEAVLKAVACGYDIGARFSMALGLTKPRSGTHSTHSLGALFGASAAAMTLMNFTLEQTASALSYSIQQASGIPYWERDSEHVEKAFDFGGMGARNGVFSAMVVDSGLTGVQDPLEGPNNYLSAFAENPNSMALTAGLGTRFEIMNASIKKWCVGSPIQAALDAVLELLAQGLKAEDIEHVNLIMPDDRILIVDNRDMPDVCLQHSVAICLIDKGMTFASSHDRARMTDPTVLALRKKMTVMPSPELTLAKPARQAILEVDTKNGRKYRHHTRAVSGTPENPMPTQDVEAKAADLLSPVIGERACKALINAIWDFEAIKDVNELARLIQGN